MVVLHRLCFEHLLVVRQLAEAAFELASACLKLLKCEYFRLLRIYQASIRRWI
jgi:hypothetical protein